MSLLDLSSTTLAALALSLVAFIVTCVHFYYKNLYSYWEKRGIKGPKPKPLVGHLADIILGDRLKFELENVQKYGKVYGIYMGKTPRLVVADPEVYCQITVKDFDVFQNHEANEFSDKFQKNFIFALQSEHWKRVRALMSPTFTSGKIKRMFRFLDGCADDLVQCFKEQLPDKSGPERSAIVNAKDLYNLFTMDAISTCCYGLKLERAGSTNLKTAATRNEFVRICMRMFDFSILRQVIMVAVPKPILRAVKFEFSPSGRMEELRLRTQSLIKSRRNAARKFDDYLQLLLDAKLSDELELNELDSEENHHAGLTHESLKADQDKLVNETKSLANGFALTDMEVLTNAMFLLAVGLETTSTLLCHATYVLAFHQDTQRKLYDELMKITEYNESKSQFTFSYEAITTCRYLDAVLSETLRVMTPVVSIDRVAGRDYRVEKYNVDIPKGTAVNLALFALGNDPDSWEEPSKFDPERFMPGNKEKIVPGSYVPFGMGPRHCIGMRFSLTEAKLALAKIMMNFRFDPAPGTTFPPAPKSFTVILYNVKTPTVKITPRAK